MSLENQISLQQIENRMVEKTIIAKMVKSYFDRVNKKQAPIDEHSITISCVDSRIPPAHVFDYKHGEAYAIQTVAAVAPKVSHSHPYQDQQIEVAAGLEYAVSFLGINQITVMGHTDCGGAEARILRPKNLPLLNKWMDNVKLKDLHGGLTPKIIAMLKDHGGFFYEGGRREAEKYCLYNSVTNTKSLPFIAQAIADGKLSLAGTICDIRNQRLNISYGNQQAFNAVSRLLHGFNRFRVHNWGDNGCMHDLVENGQHPKALIMTGISPLVAPEKVFGICAGDAFVHRSVGGHYNNAQTNVGLAATIEFAVKAKHVKSLVIVGRENGANLSYAEGHLDKFELVRTFLEMATPNIREWRESGMHPHIIHERSMTSTYFSVLAHPDVKNAVHNNKLSLAMLLVNPDTKTMRFYDPTVDKFLNVIPPAL